MYTDSYLHPTEDQLKVTKLSTFWKVGMIKRALSQKVEDNTHRGNLL